MLEYIYKYPNYEEGFYGAVFFSSDGRATKIFHRKPGVLETHVEQVFKSEVEAYERASSGQDLRNLIPTYFGCVSIHSVTNSLGEDISNNFYLDRAYQMQRISGTFVKMSELTPSIKSQIDNKFFSAGINHICDASVIIEDNVIICIIDFAIDEYILEHESTLQLDL